MKKFRRVAEVLGIALLIYGCSAWIASREPNEKIWLHRCNSIEKYHEKNKQFSNVEVDIIYRGNGIFDVTHDADTSFYLKIDPYLKEIGDNDNKIWLDIKNVSDSNCVEMCASLERLCRKYGVDKEQLIIEGGNWKALRIFTENDFYTSYYVLFPAPQKLEEEEIEQYVDSLEYIAATHSVDALSFPGWWYRDIKDNLNSSIDLLTWMHRNTKWQFYMRPIHFRMMDDPQLKVVLIKSKGDFHR